MTIRRQRCSWVVDQRASCSVKERAQVLVSNHFAARRTTHSTKPDRFYEIVEQVSPDPRIELFARRRRMGWEAWGDEAPPESEARSQVPMFAEGAA